ncbi:BON domain-containing protein [Algicella marina]|uniref:BON domain-containing protein n=1 Tax=Algicella marina TaxID=2683284 RepID=A0A6P1T1X3_9RHOB|nr:BON domain-containing protein [Algicella marina]QHQ35800.1 BON domain-containing protein [Algicella marina]
MTGRLETMTTKATRDRVSRRDSSRGNREGQTGVLGWLMMLRTHAVPDRRADESRFRLGTGTGEGVFDGVRRWLASAVENDEFSRRGAAHRTGEGETTDPSPARIEADLRKCLADEPILKAGDIAVAVRDRTVVLTGEVTSQRAKRRAGMCAGKVEGVAGLENNLSVEPSC